MHVQPRAPFIPNFESVVASGACLASDNYYSVPTQIAWNPNPPGCDWWMLAGRRWPSFVLLFWKILSLATVQRINSAPRRRFLAVTGVDGVWWLIKCAFTWPCKNKVCIYMSKYYSCMHGCLWELYFACECALCHGDIINCECLDIRLHSLHESMRKLLQNSAIVCIILGSVCYVTVTYNY